MPGYPVCSFPRHAVPAACSDAPTTDDVVARHEPKNAVCAKVVRLCRPPGVDELTFPVEELIAQRLHLHVGKRIAELVGDASGNGAAARQAEIDFFEYLPSCDVERLARLEWARLAVLEGDISGFVDGQAITPGRQRGQLYAPRCRS